MPSMLLVIEATLVKGNNFLLAGPSLEKNDTLIQLQEAIIDISGQIVQCEAEAKESDCFCIEM